MKTKDKCGCVHNGTTWTEVCREHWREHIELHSRARADYLRGQRFDPKRKTEPERLQPGNAEGLV